MHNFTLKMIAEQPICHLSDREVLPEKSDAEKYLLADNPNKEERKGGVLAQRTLRVVTPNGPVDVPCVSANSFRGITRRFGASELVKYLELEGKLSKKLYYLLFSGGGLADKGKKDPFKDPLFKKKLRQTIPLLSIYGCSLGTGMLEGKLKPDIILPVVKETVDLIGEDDLKKQTSIHAKDIIAEFMHTRRDDFEGSLEEENEENTNKSNNADNDDDKTKKKKTAAQQMIYRNQYIAAGTLFYQRIALLEATDIEISCMISIFEKFYEKPYIGGMHNKGFGRVKIIQKPEGDSSAYYKFLKDKKEEIITFLEEIKKYM